MSTAHSIRGRVLLAFAIFSILLLLSIGLVAVFAVLDTEDVVLAAQLEDEIGSLQERIESSGGHPELEREGAFRHSRFQAYLGESALPARYDALRPLVAAGELAPTEFQEGELYAASAGYFVAIREVAVGSAREMMPLVVLFDIEGLELQPRLLPRLGLYLLLGSVVALAATLSLGRALANYVLQPLDRLSSVLEAHSGEELAESLGALATPREMEALVGSLWVR